MKYKLLRALRVLIACLMLASIVALFVDVHEKVPQSFAWLAKIQFIGAVFGGSIVVFLALLLGTLLFGRLYCSIVCPLGIFQDLLAWLAAKSRALASKIGPKSAEEKEKAKVKKPKKRMSWKNYSFRKNRKWIRLAFLVYAVIAGFIGLFNFGLIEPYSIFGRIAVSVLRPFNVMLNNGLYEAFQNASSARLRYAFHYINLYPESGWALFIGILSFVVVAIFAGRYGRLYCNTVCPVGSILGWLSQFSLFKTRIDASKCIACGLCEKRCKSSCIDAKNKTVDVTRCVVCFDCFGACKKDAIRYGLGKKVTVAPNELETQPTSQLDEATLREKERVMRQAQGFDRSKRQFLTLTALAATGAIAKLASGAIRSDGDDLPYGQFDESTDAPSGAPTLPSETPADYGLTPYERKNEIMPPGAPNRAHYQHRCVGCHLCVTKCPQRVLRPAGFEHGLLGFMQPVVDYSEHRGFCNFDCTICGEVCPTGAILPLTREKKHITQIGQVVFIKENCIVYTKEERCGACSEHCPTQAVRMVPYGDPAKGLTIPETNVELCVGCGGCEYICPARPYRAIYVEGHTVQQEATPPPKEEVQEVEDVDFGF